MLAPWSREIAENGDWTGISETLIYLKVVTANLQSGLNSTNLQSISISLLLTQRGHPVRVNLSQRFVTLIKNSPECSQRKNIVFISELHLLHNYKTLLTNRSSNKSTNNNYISGTHGFKNYLTGYRLSQFMMFPSRLIRWYRMDDPRHIIIILYNVISSWDSTRNLCI